LIEFTFTEKEVGHFVVIKLSFQSNQRFTFHKALSSNPDWYGDIKKSK
jgi:hypothetical protein